MLKLYNKEHVAVAALTDLKDHKIEYVLSGEDLKEFSLSIVDENISLVEEECYVRDKDNEYVIKAMDPSQSYKRFNCIVNVESIKGKAIANFNTSNNSITDTIRLAIAGTGWILADNNITKRRTVRLKNTNALEVLREVRKVFRVDFRFDAINKIIYVYEKFGTDKGVYFSDELNLISLDIPSDTFDYITRIIPKGKDDLDIKSINNGKDYIENSQYSNKIIEYIWEDNRYTVVENLKEDALAKLEELSKPKRSYQANLADLAKMSDEYKFLDFFLGDTITLLSKTEKFRDKQRIVKYIEYPDDPSKNTCELGNTTLSFEDLQQENEYKNQVLDNITTDNDTLDGSKVDGIKAEQIYDFESSVAKITDLTATNAKIYNLEAHNVTVTGRLNAVEATIGTLEVNVATIDKITVTNTALINDLQANKASITQLEAINANIKILEADVGNIDTLVNGNLSSKNIQSGGITSDKLTIENGFIKNAMIDSLDVGKINAGDISTNKFKIKSDDGGIEIVGATQQFKDKNNKVRIQMGKDAQGNFNFIIKGEDGTTTLIDHTGVKAKAIADNLIVNTMIASDAVGEKQINYSSFTSGFNKDTNTTTLKATKIKLDNQNQSLELAFNSLKTQSDGTKTVTENNSTTINVMQGQINTAINNTQIVKDGQIILLKDDYNRTVQTVSSINSTIGSHTTKLNEATGKIENVDTRVNTVERNLDSINSRVSSTETSIVNLNTEITTTKSKVSSIETNLSSITSRVSNVETTTNNINGEIVNLSTRLNTAEQKITDASIISIVSSQFYTKGQTDNLYASKSQLTQTDTKFQFQITQSGNPNYVLNSNFMKAFKHWEKYNDNYISYSLSGWNIPTGSGVYIVGQGDKSIYVKQTVKVPPKADTYHASAYLTCNKFLNIGGRPEESLWHFYVVLRYTDGTGVTKKVPCWSDSHAPGIWKRQSLEFKRDSNKTVESMDIYLYVRYVQGNFYMGMCKVETDQLTAWCTSQSELNSGIVEIDGRGISILHNDGSTSKFTANDLQFTNENGKLKMAVKRGGISMYNYQSGLFLGLDSSTQFSNEYSKFGMQKFASKHCSFYDILYSPTTENDENLQVANSTFRVCFENLESPTDWRSVKGIHSFMLHRFHEGIDMVKKPITSCGTIFLGTATTRNKVTYDEMYDEMQIGGGAGGVILGKTNPDGSVEHAIKIYENYYIDTFRDWNFQGHKIENANIKMNYSLMNSSPGMSVGADTASVETMLLQEDFSEYDEKNNAVIVDMNKGFKVVYENNKNLENENEQLKQQNKELKNRLATTQETMDLVLMKGVV